MRNDNGTATHLPGKPDLSSRIAEKLRYAGEKNPSMTRRRNGHDYGARRMYLITITVEGRRPLFGLVAGDPQIPYGEEGAPHIVLTPIGKAVEEAWMNIGNYYPEVQVIALQLMPDHLHGILFVRERMERHLGNVIKGFKVATNKAYRTLRDGVANVATMSQLTKQQRQQRQQEQLQQQEEQEQQQQQEEQEQQQQQQQQGKLQQQQQQQQGKLQQQQQEEQEQQQQQQQQEQQQQGKLQEQQQGKLQEQQQQEQGKQQEQPIAVSPHPTRPDGTRDRSLDDRKHGMLWSIGYTDGILDSEGQLQRWKEYLRDNPRRLLMKRQHPELFRVQRNVQVGDEVFTMIGNRWLLERPIKLQVRCSRRLTDAEIEEKKTHFLEQAQRGAVLVSPSISKGEKMVMRAAFDAGYPLILLQENGFTDLAKPGGKKFDACAEGRLLILAPWEHHNERRTIRRDQCLTLNDMAAMICRG